MPSGKCGIGKRGQLPESRANCNDRKTKRNTATEEKTTASKKQANVENIFKTKIKTKEAEDTPRAPRFKLSRHPNKPSIFKKQLGLFSISNPKKSRICEEKITAILAVNPVITGWGIYLIHVPSLAAPAIKSMIPAIIVVINNPSYPWRPITL